VKPVVVLSVNDDTETWCIDVRQEDDGFSWVECRRDPEDNHGWRIITGPSRGFATLEAAWAAARETVGWV
jgi:hypothetical protein